MPDIEEYFWLTPSRGKVAHFWNRYEASRKTGDPHHAVCGYEFVPVANHRMKDGETKCGLCLRIVGNK